MPVRKKPAAICGHCGRTLTLRSESAQAYGRLGYKFWVNPGCLVPHKCQHGNYCDECPKAKGGK